MWLLRGLKFTSLGLKINLENKDEELSASFTKAYEQSLKKYHGMMIRPVFYVSRCADHKCKQWYRTAVRG